MSEREGKKGKLPMVSLGDVVKILLMVGGLIGIWRTLETRQVVSEQRLSVLEEQRREDRQTFREISASLQRQGEIQVKITTLLDYNILQQRTSTTGAWANVFTTTSTGPMTVIRTNAGGQAFYRVQVKP